METELAIESIIEQKNLPDSFVLITESSISVTVDQQDLDTSTVAKICDIVMRETGESADKIIIQSKY
ncbi:MAG: SpoIIIAH-like family protein [Anaerovoracaceae bacterium]